MSATPSPNNTAFGRGAVLFDRFTAAGARTGEFLHLGNCSNLSIATKVQTIEMIDYTSSTSANYNQAVKKTDIDLKIDGFEISPDVLALIVMGTTTSFTQANATAAGFSTTLVPASLTSVQGKFFSIGARGITLPTLKQGTVTLVSGTDYSLFDPAAGVFQITVGGAVVDSTAVTANYVQAAFTAGSSSLSVVQAANSATIRGRLWFLPNNTTGPNVELLAWNVSLTPDGDVPLISDDWIKWQMAGKILSDAGGTYGGSTTNPFYQTTTR
jgi:hypothetical protein